MPNRLCRLVPRGARVVVCAVAASLLALLLCAPLTAQDASTGAIRGTVSDASGARLPQAQVLVIHAATGLEQRTHTDERGVFLVAMLPPGLYSVRVTAEHMAPREFAQVIVEVGGLTELRTGLAVAGVTESVAVEASAPWVETLPTGVSSVLDERAILEMPLNGRRFSDLALLTPGVTQDPRSLTSATQGDLSFGGIRGFQNSILVDGADNNNGFYAQQRGRYSAPYQFSNEVIQEFRVSSSNYAPEMGRSGGAVINVVTRSGSNQVHGSFFYYLRDSALSAQQPFMPVNPANRQQQFGATLGGPIRKNKLFYYLGFDQHIFHIPGYVQFANGSSTVTPTPADYEVTDQTKVFAAAQKLSQMGGVYRSSLLGNAAFAKLDWTVNPRNQLSMRLSTSRYYGINNFYFDPSSPITNYAASENGSSQVATESVTLSLTSALGYRTTSHLRLMFSHDLQAAAANSSAPLTEVYGIISGFGRSAILPRTADEHRVNLAETLQIERKRHSLKFGGDALFSLTRSYFPELFGGEYIFDNISVNPFTFAPQRYGLAITPLRAYAHQVPRYYMQNFGSALSHPDSNEFALFAQDTMRLTNRFALTFGLRWDGQTFNTSGMTSNPLWPQAGRMPLDLDNFAPRAGFAYSLGKRDRPLVVRGGWGLFFTRIPQIYSSAVATNNGVNNGYLFIDSYEEAYVSNPSHLMPTYPNPFVACAPGATTCPLPSGFSTGLGSSLSREVSAFAPNFRTPYVEQANLGIEREVARHLTLGLNYLYVHGVHLIRALDVNLPAPITVQYPVYDQNNQFTGQYYTVQSFTTWQTSASATCPTPPCINPLVRPIPQLGSIDQFESNGSSVYHGLTASLQRRMTSGLYFRLAYTWAHAIDDTQDALLTSYSTVQNSYNTTAERGNSTTDQRHRFVFAWVGEPQPFRREHPLLRKFFNNWKFSNVITAGSGRPVTTQVTGDLNGDGNLNNDRLPGVSRNSLIGPGYFTVDMRLARKLHATERWRLEALVECFNLLNRDNKRIVATNDGFYVTGADFVSYRVVIGSSQYPAYVKQYANYTTATSSYAPRQMQLSLRVRF
jgi:hypothetical protein